MKNKRKFLYLFIPLALLIICFAFYNFFNPSVPITYSDNRFSFVSKVTARYHKSSNKTVITLYPKGKHHVLAYTSNKNGKLYVTAISSYRGETKKFIIEYKGKVPEIVFGEQLLSTE